MKKFLSIFSFALIALFATSCDNKEPNTPDTPDTPVIPNEIISPEDFDIQIEIKDITATSATAVATPNGANRYYFRVITKMELDAFSIYNDDYQIFEYIIENPHSGDWITEGQTTLECTLAAETDYLAVAFNYENWEDMHLTVDEIKLFRKAFKTDKAEAVDPSTLFITEGLITDHSNFNLDVTPAKADALWTYYIWTKASYDETVASEAQANIVMRSYFGLQNLAVEQGYLFGDIIQTDKLGHIGKATISAYEPLKNNTEYVVVIFYVDPEAQDPTNIYDYNYVAVPFKTQAPTGDKVNMQVSEPIIESSGFTGYTIKFNIKVDQSCVDLKQGPAAWDDSKHGKYWDPTDWNTIRAFHWLYSVSEETLKQAKTAEGCVISYTAEGKDDMVFFFEALNSENVATQHVVRVTPDMY